MAAPTAPDGLTWTVTASDEFALSWNDNALAEDGYRVYESTDGGASFTNISGDLAIDTTSYTTAAKTTTQVYGYYVEAFNADGTSTSSTQYAQIDIYARDTRMAALSVEMSEATPAAVDSGSGSGSASPPPLYLANDDIDSHGEMAQDASNTDVENGTGQEVAMTIGATLDNDTMPTASTMQAGDTSSGTGETKTQDIALVSYDDNSALSIYQSVSKDAGGEWPIKVEQQIELTLDDITKLASFDATIDTNCEADIQITGVEVNEGTGQVVLTVEAVYNCADDSAEITLSPDKTETADTLPTITETTVNSPTTTSSYGTATLNDWSWDTDYDYPTYTNPPALRLGSMCLPTDEIAAVPLSIRYGGPQAEPVYGWEAKLDYDPAVLTFDSATASSSTKTTFAAPTVVYNDTAAGVVKLKAEQGTPFEPWAHDTANTLCNVSFTLPGVNGDQSRVAFVETYDADYQSNSPYRGERPADVVGEGGSTVNWKTYSGDLDWRPFRFSNGSVSLGNGINLSGADTTYGEEVGVTVAVNAATDVSGYDLDFGYPAADTDVPFTFTRAVGVDMPDPTVSADDERGILTATADQEAQDIAYTDPTLCTLYFEPQTPQGDTSNLDVKWLGGELWDVNRATIAVDCTSPGTVNVENSTPTSAIGNTIQIFETDASNAPSWPLVINQTYTVDGVLTNQLDEMHVEVTSETNPDITAVVNAVTTTATTASANVTIVIPKADSQSYPVSFVPHIWFEWGNGMGLRASGLNIGSGVNTGHQFSTMVGNSGRIGIGKGRFTLI